MALDFKEAIVAGGSKDFAVVRHLVLRGSNREIGRKIAEIAQKPVKLSIEDIKANNACVAMTRLTLPGESATDPKPTRTLWHAVYDSHEKSVEINHYLGEDPASENGTRRSRYQRFHLQA